MAISISVEPMPSTWYIYILHALQDPRFKVGVFFFLHSRSAQTTNNRHHPTFVNQIWFCLLLPLSISYDLCLLGACFCVPSSDRLWQPLVILFRRWRFRCVPQMNAEISTMFGWHFFNGHFFLRNTFAHIARFCCRSPQFSRTHTGLSLVLSLDSRKTEEGHRSGSRVLGRTAPRPRANGCLRRERRRKCCLILLYTCSWKVNNYNRAHL